MRANVGVLFPNVQQTDRRRSVHLIPLQRGPTFLGHSGQDTARRAWRCREDATGKRCGGTRNGQNRLYFPAVEARSTFGITI